MSGLAAVLLKTIVHWSGRYVMALGTHHLLPFNSQLFFAPLIGILLTVVFVRYIIKGNIGHGIPSVLLAISRKKGVLPPRNMYSSLVASTLTVAFGGSVGLEAPGSNSCWVAAPPAPSRASSKPLWQACSSPSRC